jgi:Enoyl-(Acyl carrier protein) reductase
MLAAGHGTIVNVSSVNSFLADPAVIDYCAAKAALANFSKSLALEVGPKGVRVNAVSPGPVSTELWLGDQGVAATVAQANEGDPSAVAEAQASQAATGRFTEPSEVADLVVLLASERAANTTGSDFLIDGGLVRTLYLPHRRGSASLQHRTGPASLSARLPALSLCAEGRRVGSRGRWPAQRSLRPAPSGSRSSRRSSV